MSFTYAQWWTAGMGEPATCPDMDMARDAAEAYLSMVPESDLGAPAGDVEDYGVINGRLTLVRRGSQWDIRAEVWSVTEPTTYAEILTMCRDGAPDSGELLARYESAASDNRSCAAGKYHPY